MKKNNKKTYFYFIFSFDQYYTMHIKKEFNINIKYIKTTNKILFSISLKKNVNEIKFIKSKIYLIIEKLVNTIGYNNLTTYRLVYLGLIYIIENDGIEKFIRGQEENNIQSRLTYHVCANLLLNQNKITNLKEKNILYIDKNNKLDESIILKKIINQLYNDLIKKLNIK